MTLCVTYRVAPITDGGFCDLVAALTTLRYHYLSKIYFPIKYGGRLWSRVRRRNNSHINNNKPVCTLPLLDGGNGSATDCDSPPGCCRGLLSRSSRSSRSSAQPGSGEECRFRQVELTSTGCQVKKRQNKKRRGFRINPCVRRDRSRERLEGDAADRRWSRTEDVNRRHPDRLDLRLEEREERDSWRESGSIYVAFFKSQQSLALDSTDASCGKTADQQSATSKIRSNSTEKASGSNANDACQKAKQSAEAGCSNAEHKDDEQKTIVRERILGVCRSASTEKPTAQASAAMSHHSSSKENLSCTLEEIRGNRLIEEDNRSPPGANKTERAFDIHFEVHCEGPTGDIPVGLSPKHTEPIHRAIGSECRRINEEKSNDTRSSIENGHSPLGESSHPGSPNGIHFPAADDGEMMEPSRAVIDSEKYSSDNNSSSTDEAGKRGAVKTDAKINFARSEKRRYFGGSGAQQIPMPVEFSSSHPFDCLSLHVDRKLSLQPTGCCLFNADRGETTRRDPAPRQRHSFDSSSLEPSTTSLIVDAQRGELPFARALSQDSKYPSAGQLSVGGDETKKDAEEVEEERYDSEASSFYVSDESSLLLGLSAPPRDRVYGQWQARLMEDSEGDEVDFKIFQRMRASMMKKKNASEGGRRGEAKRRKKWWTKKTFSFEKLRECDGERSDAVQATPPWRKGEAKFRSADVNGNLPAGKGTGRALKKAFPLNRVTEEEEEVDVEREGGGGVGKAKDKFIGKKHELVDKTDCDVDEFQKKNEKDREKAGRIKKEIFASDEKEEKKAGVDSICQDFRGHARRSKGRENKKLKFATSMTKTTTAASATADDQGAPEARSSRSGRAPPNFDMWGFLGEAKNKSKARNESRREHEAKMAKKIDRTKNAERLVISNEHRIEFVEPEPTPDEEDGETTALLPGGAGDRDAGGLDRSDEAVSSRSTRGHCRVDRVSREHKNRRSRIGIRESASGRQNSLKFLREMKIIHGFGGAAASEGRAGKGGGDWKKPRDKRMRSRLHPILSFKMADVHSDDEDDDKSSIAEKADDDNEKESGKKSQERDVIRDRLKSTPPAQGDNEASRVEVGDSNLEQLRNHVDGLATSVSELNRRLISLLLERDELCSTRDGLVSILKRHKRIQRHHHHYHHNQQQQRQLQQQERRQTPPLGKYNRSRLEDANDTRRNDEEGDAELNDNDDNGDFRDGDVENDQLGAGKDGGQANDDRSAKDERARDERKFVLYDRQDGPRISPSGESFGLLLQ